MVEAGHPALSVSKQCELLSISRSSFYYAPKGETAPNLGLMRLMGLMPIYRKPNTSKPTKGHKVSPYLLRHLRIDLPNQVCAADITYLPPLGRLLCNRLPGNGCGVDSCISWRLWTGTRARFWHGGFEHTGG